RQAPQILMMMKRVAASPINKLDLRIDPRLEIVAIALPGLKQKIGHARARNMRRRLVWKLRYPRNRRTISGVAHTVHRAIAKSIPLPWQTNASQRRSQCNERPKRLLSIDSALQAPGRRQHASLACQGARQSFDGPRRNTGNGARPPRRFRDTIALAEDVIREGLKAGRVRRYKFFVLQVIGEKNVDQCKNESGIGIGLDRDVFAFGNFRLVAAERRNRDDLRALPGKRLEMPSKSMNARAARLDFPVLLRHAAEGNDNFRILDNLFHGRYGTTHRFGFSYDVRKERHRSTKAVIRLLRGESAASGKKSMQKITGVMDTAS